MMYLVTWVLVSCYSIPCPDYKPDAYGRWPTMICAVNHMECEEEKKSKEFKTKEEAEKFVADAGDYHAFVPAGNSVRDFKITEIK